MSGEPQQLLGLQGAATLYVSNVPPQVDEIQLYDFFNRADSQIVSVRIVRREPNTPGYAYLNFNSQEQAAEALKTQNYLPFHGYIICLAKNVKPHSLDPNANLYSSGYTVRPHEKDLADAFGVFGPVMSVRVREFQNKYSAYVQFETTEAANNALAQIQVSGIKIGEQEEKINIAPFRSRSDRQNLFTNVFVRNFPANFQREQFRYLAEEYGKVTSVYFPTSYGSKPGSNEPSPTGFGFANYESPEDARNAIIELSKRTIGDFQLQAFQAKDRDARARELAATKNQYVSNNQRPRPNVQRFRNAPLASSLTVYVQPNVTMQTLYSQLPQMTIKGSFELSHNRFVVHFHTPEAANAARLQLSQFYKVAFRYPRPSYPKRQNYPRYHHYPYDQNFYNMHPQAQMRPRQTHPHHNQHNQQYPRHHHQQHPQQQHHHQQQQQHPQHHPQQPQSQSLSDEERQTLGSELYYKIQDHVNGDEALTSKITGMLLELQADEIRALVRDEAAIREKVHEARQILGNAP